MAIQPSVFKSIIFLVSTIVFSTQAQWPTDEDACNIPGSGTGECIPIHECNSIINLLEILAKGEGNLSTEIIKLLRSYQCGFYQNSIKVCCPKEVLFPKSEFNIQIPNEDSDIKNHKNFRLLPYDCGMSQISDRISGGDKTVFGEFPWMVLINYSTGKTPSFKCGGTIINDRYILTAAHCITNLNNLKPTTVRIGEHNITSVYDCDRNANGVTQCAPPVQDIYIEEILPHPDFNSAEFMNDIGLLRLATPINISIDTAKPICLPLQESVQHFNFTNTKLTITGWGLTEFGRTSDILLKVNIPIHDRSECEKAYARSSVKLSSLHLCGGGKTRHDSCGGDSGGPLQRVDNYNADARYVQYGIVSFGAKTCGRVGVPGVYTRVDHYINWILNTIRP